MWIMFCSSTYRWRVSWERYALVSCLRWCFTCAGQKGYFLSFTNTRSATSYRTLSEAIISFANQVILKEIQAIGSESYITSLYNLLCRSCVCVALYLYLKYTYIIGAHRNLSKVGRTRSTRIFLISKPLRMHFWCRTLPYDLTCTALKF